MEIILDDSIFEETAKFFASAAVKDEVDDDDSDSES